MDLPETRFSQVVDANLVRIGKAIGVIWVLLMLVIVANVIARYLFSEGRIEFEELQWHLYSTGFMCAIGYGLVSDSHIRVDVLHERFSDALKVWIDLYGIILLVLPFTAMMLIYGVPFVAYSYETGEVSASPGGLPFRWLIKSVLLVGFVLLAFAAISRLTRLIAYLKQHAN